MPKQVRHDGSHKRRNFFSARLYLMNAQDRQTIQTYDDSAEELAKYFAGNDWRLGDVKLALHFAGDPAKPKVVELGCGDGRDAEDILSLVDWYEGFDPSIRLIELARRRLPKAHFVCADALSYTYPHNLDAVYGFASFVHLNKDDFAAACKLIAASLKPGGVLFFSLKERDKYAEELVKDEFGERTFYYYSAPLVRELMGKDFEAAYEDHRILKRKTSNWLVMALRKKEGKV